MTFHFASRMAQFEGSGIRKMFELAAAMKNPINLSLGQADFDVPEPVKEVAIKAIREGKNRYSITAGEPDFQAAVKKFLASEGIEVESAMAVAGASGGLVLALFAFAEAGCEVLIPDPYFVCYGALVQLTGATPRWIDTYPSLKLTPEKLRAAVTPKSKVLIFNSPSNPTGIAYTKEETAALAKTAKELGLQVISDEVYDTFCYDFPHHSWLKFDKDAVLVRSFSKTAGMPGWRSGYVAGPAEILEKLKILQQFTFVCTNTPAQWASIEALRSDISHHIAAYKKKRDMVCSILSEEFKFIKPSGAFYIFPEIPGGDSQNFIKSCIEKELLIVPGKAFSQRDTHFRISYATDDATLKRGLEILLDIARKG